LRNYISRIQRTCFLLLRQQMSIRHAIPLFLYCYSLRLFSNCLMSSMLVNGFMLIHSSSPDDIYSFSFRSATCRRTVPCRIALPGSVLHHGRERNRGLGIRGYGMCLILSPVWTVFSISCQFTSLWFLGWMDRPEIVRGSNSFLKKIISRH